MRVLSLPSVTYVNDYVDDIVRDLSYVLNSRTVDSVKRDAVIGRARPLVNAVF